MNHVRRQAGFSLVELMIAAVIGLVLLGGVISISINSSRTQRELEQIGRQVENGRYAVAILEETLEHTGYYGEYYELAAAPGALPDPCTTTIANIQAAIPLPIQGYDNVSGATGLTCLPDAAHKDNTDILVIRRASTAPATGALTTGELYLQTRADDMVLDTAASGETSTSPGPDFDLLMRGGATPANIRKFHVEIYFVGPDANSVPTLKRRVLTQSGGALGFEEEELVGGIEYFEVEYGIDRSGDGSPNESGVGAGDAYERASDVTVAEFADVVALKLHMVARSNDTFAGHSDEKKYDLGLENEVGPFNDAYRRRAFSTAIRAVNVAIRRE